MGETEEVEQLRDKVRNLDSELYKLRTLANKAIGDYDELFGKYREARKCHDELLKKYQTQEVKLEQVVQVLEGAANEVAALESKVQLEHFLQVKAENFASEMLQENQKIKRQSQKIMAALGENAIAIDIDIDAPPEPDDNASSEQKSKDITQLQETVSQLKKTIETMQSNFNNCRIEKEKAVAKSEEFRILYEEEKEKLKGLTHNAAMVEAMKENFHRVTDAAQRRIEVLEGIIDFERSLKEEVVQKASSLHTKHQVLKRQSMAVVQASSRGDESLNRALEQIQKLTVDMESQKQEYESRLAKVSEEKDSEMMRKLEEDIEKLQQEYDRVSQQNEALIHKLEAANYDNRVIREQLDQAKKGPPPPPPPPPPPVKVLNPIKWIMGKGTKPETNKGPKKPEGSEAFDVALGELMKRIKNRSNQQPSEDLQKLLDNETRQTSQQLNDFIGALKKTEFQPLPKRAPEPEPEPEFLKKQRQMKMSRSKSESCETGDPVSDVPDEDRVQLRRPSLPGKGLDFH